MDQQTEPTLQQITAKWAETRKANEKVIDAEFVALKRKAGLIPPAALARAA